MINFFALDVKGMGVSSLPLSPIICNSSSYAVHWFLPCFIQRMMILIVHVNHCPRLFPTSTHAEKERERVRNDPTVRARQKQRRINFNVLTIPLGFRHCLLTDFDLSCRRNGFRLRWSEKISDERKGRRREKESDCNRSNWSGTRERETGVDINHH